MNPENYYSTYARAQKKANKFRSLPSCALNLPYAGVKPDCRDFSTNDYLGLSAHPRLIAAAHEAGLRYGVGATGSRLLSGNRDIFITLEAQIAKDKNTQAALIFNYGYQANVSVLAALLDKRTLKQQALVFFDKANHHSLYQGVALSDAHLVRYSHGDRGHLKKRLHTYRQDERPKFIVSETLFGMDGGLAYLEELRDLAQEFKAFLYLDEAHATGLFGPHGYGLSTTLNLEDIPHLVMGTFSKALGCCGAYVACSQITKDYLINHCGGFIYSTALSPMVIGASAAAWEMVPSLREVRAALFRNAANLQNVLRQKFNMGRAHTHIIPLILGEEMPVLRAREALHSKGMLVSAIRPPTVPAGTARLRIAVTAKHTPEDLSILAHELLQL